MDFEVVYCPRAEAISNALLMDERHELLDDGEFVLWLRRISGFSNLFMYRHKESGAFVLAQWICKEPRACIEIDTFNQPPDWIQGSIGNERYWKDRLKTDDEVARIMAAKIRDARYEEREARLDSALDKRKQVKRLKKRGQDNAAKLLEMGATPHVGERESKLLGMDCYDEIFGKDFKKPRAKKKAKEAATPTVQPSTPAVP